MSKTLEQRMTSYSMGYAFVRNFIAVPGFKLFYRNIHVIGAEKVPDEGPIVFTPNHQNALMDAMCILCTKNRQPVFVARADIFQKPVIIKALHSLRILPIYRKRDGVNTSDNNQETFDIILKVLHHGRSVGIMPEGTHSEIKHLRALQKGVFRIAMKAQEEYGNRPGVKIIPVGLEYGDLVKFRSDVIIKYGEAIDLSGYYDLYTENPNRAFKVLQDLLTERMKEGMIHIENQTYYTEIEQMRVIYARQAARKMGLDYNNGENQLHIQQSIIAAMENLATDNPGAMEILCSKIRSYLAILKNCRIDDQQVAKPFSLPALILHFLLIFLGIPIWISGTLMNYIPYRIAYWGSHKVKDPQFISSVQYVIGLIVYPLFQIILAILFIIFIPCIWGKLVMILLPVPLGVMTYNIYMSVGTLTKRWIFWRGMRKKDPSILQASALRKTIFDILDKMIK